MYVRVNPPWFEATSKTFTASLVAYAQVKGNLLLPDGAIICQTCTILICTDTPRIAAGSTKRVCVVISSFRRSTQLTSRTPEDICIRFTGAL